MSNHGNASRKPKFEVITNDAPLNKTSFQTKDFFSEIDLEQLDYIKENTFKDILSTYSQIASSKQDQKDGDSMSNGNDLGRFIDKLDSDFREREQRLSKDAAERESRFHQHMIEQDKRYREEMKAIEERNEKMLNRISEEIKDLRTDVKESNSQMRQDINRATDNINSMKKHTQGLVIASVAGIAAMVISVVVLAITIYSKL